MPSNLIHPPMSVLMQRTVPLTKVVTDILY
jgi:hypothetical protein